MVTFYVCIIMLVNSKHHQTLNISTDYDIKAICMHSKLIWKTHHLNSKDNPFLNGYEHHCQCLSCLIYS